MPKTRGKKKSEYEKQLEKTRKAVQKVKDTKYKAQLEKTAKAVKKVKDTKAVVKQVKKVKKAVQKVKDTKYKAQLEKTGKAVQKVKDTKYKAQLEKTAMAVKKVKDTKAALKPKKKAAPKKKFSDDVSDVETKAPTIKKGTKISATFKEIKEKPKKKAAPKKLVSDEKMDRMKRKVLKLGKEQVKEKKKVGRGVAKEAKKLKAIDALPDVDPEAEMDAMFGKAKEPRKFVEKASSSKDLSKIKAKPDVMGGLFNAAHITLGNLIEKQFKDMNAEIKKYKTADAGYFEKVSKGGVSQYHTMGGDALIVHQKLVEKQFGKAIALAPGGVGNPKIQALIRSYNKRGKSGLTRARKAKYEAEQRLGLE